MKRNRILPAVAVAAGLLLSSTACGGGDNANAATGDKPTATFAPGTTMAKIQQRGKLIVGVKYDQPLFGLKNPVSGKLEGMDIELAKELAKQLTGSADNVEFVETVTKNREAFLQQNKVDVVIASYAVTDARKKAVDFAGPYLHSQVGIMTRKTDTSINTPQDLNGKNVCTTTGARAASLVPEEAPQAKITLFSTYSECAQALKENRVDAVTTTEALLLGVMSQNQGQFRMASGHLADSEDYAIGSPKGDDALHAYLDDFLKKIEADGEWKKIYDDTVGTVKPGDATPPAISL